MDNLLDAKSQKALISKNSKSAREFIDGVLDSKSFVETDAFLFTKNELTDDKLVGEGVVTGYGTINSQAVYIYCQNYSVLKGGLGAASAKKIIKCMDAAAKSGVPLISVLHTAGARLGEGITALEGFGEIISKAVSLKGVIPQITVIKGDCFGHMSCLASLSDFVYMIEGASLLSGAPQVIAAKSEVMLTAKEIGGADTHAVKSGIATFKVKNTAELAASIKKLLSYISNEEVVPLSAADLNRSIKTPAKYDGRKLASDITDADSFFELYSVYERATITAFGRIGGKVVGIIADSGENQLLSIGQIKKITKFVRLLDFYGIPLISLVNSQGVSSCVKCEQDGIVQEIAKLMCAVSESDIAKIAIVCGSAIGMSFTALASRSMGFDYSLAWEKAVISSIPANVGAVMLYQEELTDAKNSDKVRAELEKRYAVMESSPVLAAENGCIDNIIPSSATRQYIISALQMVE